MMGYFLHEQERAYLSRLGDTFRVQRIAKGISVDGIRGEYTWY